MRIINGLKYTLVDQFKVLLFATLSAIVILIGFTVLFISNDFVLRFEWAPIFVYAGVIILIFMGASYAPIYFRTLIQGGFTRLEIFIILVITDIVLLISGLSILFISLAISLSNHYPAMIRALSENNINVLSYSTMFILGTFASRTLFNCVGLIINKFNNRFAATFVGVIAYFLLGAISRNLNSYNVFRFLNNYGVITSVVCLAVLFSIQFMIIKTHNSKPITK